MASTYLTKTFTASNRKTFTVSCWVKRSSITAQQAIFSTGNGNTGPLNLFGFNATDNLTYWEYSDGSTGLFDLQGAATLRDTSAWYHIVLSVDTTQSTASDRVKFYVNGELVTAFDGTYNTYPNQNQDLAFNQADQHAVGRYEYNNSGYFDGLISHFHFIDGTAYAPTVFGETDATTGEWKIKTNVTATYGTNGFFILKDGNSVTDQSGNSNNFTVGGGTLTNTEDCPSNVFATLNRLDRSRKNTNNGGDYLSKGNLTFDTTSSNGMMAIARSTLGVQSGKWYWEAKIIDNARMSIGITKESIMGKTDPYYDLTEYIAIAMNLNGTITGRYTGSAADEYATGTSNTANDVLGFALDMDNKELYIHKNGTYVSNGSAVGVPTSGASRTGGLIDALTGSRDDYLPDGELIFPFVHDVSTSGPVKVEFNFGNGYFGTTAISSEGTNASGIGKFEYDVPTGYTALSTKGLNL